jgi:hypothetical protein
MRKLFALFLCATFIVGDFTIAHLNASASGLKDERAEALLAQARQAIGGEAAINAVTNLLINGKVSHKINLPDLQAQSVTGDVEMALELPDKLHKQFKIGSLPGAGAETDKKFMIKRADVIVHRSAEAGEASPERIQKRVAAPHSNDLSRLMFGLLLKASPAFGAAYNYLGEGTVDGTNADIVEARNEAGGAIKLYLDKQSHLPLMMSYRGVKRSQMLFIKKDGENAANIEKDVIILNDEKLLSEGPHKFTIRKRGENGAMTEDVRSAPLRVQMEEADIQLRFSDYRSVNGLMLPHRLVESVNGQETELTTVDSYQINVSNLAEKFKDSFQRVRVPKIERVN